MHKQPKNDKVLKAITIGIAAMMATSAMPATVFANENPDTPEPAPQAASENNSSEVTNNSGSEETTATQEVSEIQESVDNAVTDVSGTGGAIELIDAALADANVIGDQLIIDDLTLAQQALSGTETNAGASAQLQDAQQALATAASAEANADIMINTADAAVDDLNDLIDDYNTADTITREQADATVSNAQIANTTGSEKEAYLAKDNAKENLSLVEEGFKEANDAFFDAQAKADAAESSYEVAEAEHKAALAKVEEAKAKLMEAQANSIAASEMLKAAQDRANSLEREMEKLEKNKAQLEAIRTQYYAMMIRYYNKALGNDVVFNSKGELDVEACAKKISEIDGKIDQMAKSPGDNKIFFLGEDLLKKLVEYQVMNDENVDFANSGFKFGGTKGDTKTAVEGHIYSEKTGDGTIRDQVVVDETNRKDADGNKVVNPNEKYTLKMEKSTYGDAGRTNRFEVTYTDKEGNKQTRYFNYILKNSQYDGEIDANDMASGPIYLAEVKKGEDGKWYTERVAGENDVADYRQLIDAITTVQNYDQTKADWEAAKEDMQKAADKVDQLTEDIEALKNVKADDSRLKELKDQLDAAKEALNEATEKKITLQQKVEEAEEAYKSIDLSRFNVRPASAEEDDDSAASGGLAGGTDLGSGLAGGLGAGPAAGGATGGAAGSGSYTIPTVNAPLSGGTAVAGGGITLTDAELPGAGSAEGTEATGDEISIAGLMANASEESGQEQNLVTLADEQLAGAMTATTGEATKSDEAMNWLWLLIIALFGAAGRKMYEKYKERKEQGSDNLQA